MAKRYGGAHSPGGGKTLSRARPVRMGARVNLLFAAPVLIAIAAFFREPEGLFAGLAGFALMIGAAALTREGLKAEDAYHARAIARRPAFPRKMAGSVLTGLGLAVAYADPLPSALIGVMGAALHFAAFGADPLRSKGIAEGGYRSDRVLQVVEEAEGYITQIREAVAPLRDRGLTERTEAFVDAARGVIAAVERDPSDINRARRFLGVYLMGARDAARKFAELYARSEDSAVRADYEALLGDLEAGYRAHARKLALDDRSDLDIEMDVLRERLDREGVLTEEQR